MRIAVDEINIDETIVVLSVPEAVVPVMTSLIGVLSHQFADNTIVKTLKLIFP